MVMGTQSLFVMLKLGFELRSCYEPLMDEPLPEHLHRLVDRLPAGGRDILELRPVESLF